MVREMNNGGKIVAYIFFTGLHDLETDHLGSDPDEIAAV